jgi:succinate dehydrogenase/fumarate reductase cytochrome b subunit
MFVWVFHRVSGLVLILLIGLKIVTGYGILGRLGDSLIEPMRSLHRSVALDVVVAGLFIFHALYGLRTCLVDLGVRREKALFWICTGLGLALFLATTWLLILPRFGG